MEWEHLEKPHWSVQWTLTTHDSLNLIRSRIGVFHYARWEDPPGEEEIMNIHMINENLHHMGFYASKC